MFLSFCLSELTLFRLIFQQFHQTILSLVSFQGWYIIFQLFQMLSFLFSSPWISKCFVLIKPKLQVQIYMHVFFLIAAFPKTWGISTSFSSLCVLLPLTFLHLMTNPLLLNPLLPVFIAISEVYRSNLPSSTISFTTLVCCARLSAGWLVSGQHSSLTP